jgi:hypothetical protein
MLKKLLALLFVSTLMIWLAIPVFAQEGSSKGDAMGASAKDKDDKKADKKGGKQERWEGVITRSNKDKSTFTVRQRSTNAEKTVVYDSSTKFSASEHHGKPKEIDPGDIKDGDRIIALGKWEDKGSVLHATSISKRLTQH